MRECVRFISTNIFLTAFKMSNCEETSSRGEPQNMTFKIKAMQQQFKHLNMVLREIGEKMNRYDTVITNLQGRLCNENEVESGSGDDYEFEIEMGRHRPRGVRHGRGNRRNNPRGRNEEDGSLGNIKKTIRVGMILKLIWSGKRMWS